MFFGREDQMEQLEALWDKRVSPLVTCRGRRRVGKSTLVEEFARRSGARFIKIEGVRPGDKTTAADELRAFAKQLARQTEAAKEPQEDWYSAFGVRIDFFDDATETYADSVYLHNGIFYGGFNPNKQDPRMNDFPLFPWGTQAAASLDHEYQGNEWDVDLSQFAPEGWLNGQRRASISFEMRNVGPNARAAIQLINN